MPRPIQATIDTQALRHNQLVARRHAGDASLWSVVKANAYGHGLVEAATVLQELTDGFALLDIADAVELREAGIRQPILMIEGFFAEEELPLFGEYGLTSVVHCFEQLEMLGRVTLPVQLPVYLKINTGMNRLGFRPENFPSALASLVQIPHVGDITLMTHFADADGESDVTAALTRFQQLRQGAQLPVSMANSAALLRYPDARGDWVRPGIMLYGSSPFPQRASAAELGLRPVMTLASAVIAVQQLAPGERVGYGGLFQAQAPTRIGIVACGYADGYPRHAPTGTPVLVGGQRTRTLGRVSMDMLAVDLTELPQASIGTPVVLWGEALSADEVAQHAETVSYELFCGLARRVPTKYV
jgi:alanine racemase